jgi:glucokinase
MSGERDAGRGPVRILAGDIGGTNSRLAIYKRHGGQIEMVGQQTFPSGEYSCVDEIVEEFLEARSIHCDAVCLGLPGPIGRDGVVQLTNLPWQVDRERLRESLHVEWVELINDVEASAIGVHERPVDEFVCLRGGRPDPNGNRAVISLGTGLGVAGLSSVGRAFATEAGHATFAPRNDFDLEMLRALGRDFDHVSWERVASGQGIPRIYSMLAPQGSHALDASEIVARADSDAECRRTLDVFCSYVGAVAGNITLTMMATGGVYFCGGVAPKVMDAVGGDSILESMVDKGRMRPLLERMPVYLVRDDNLALTGAAHKVLRHAEQN